MCNEFSFGVVARSIGAIDHRAILRWIAAFYVMRQIGSNLLREANPVILKSFARLCFGWWHVTISPNATHSVMEAY